MSSEPRSRSRLLVAALILLVIANLFTAGLLFIPSLRQPFQAVQPSPADANLSATPRPALPSPSPSASPQATRPPGQTALPTQPPASSQEGLRQQGVIFLALSDGKFSHLFAYHPLYLPLTRLTNGAWDDIHPQISPDGTRITYASRQNGYWDIFQMDIASGQKIRLTDTPEYDGSPTWSPDSQWLAYETYKDNHLQVVIRSLANPDQPLIDLTTGGVDHYSPTWSPMGREIAFVSTEGESEDIWVARLDVVDDRFVNLTSTSTGRNRFPRWSPDGRFLAWASDTPGISTIYVWDSASPDAPPRQVGNGDAPAWRPDGLALLAAVQSSNQSALGGYAIADGSLIFPTNPLPGALHGMDWKAGQTGASFLKLSLPASTRQSAQPLWQRKIASGSPVPGQRSVLVPLAEVNTSTAFLHDAVDEAFSALRQHTSEIAGWDFLANLDNAYLPLTSPTYPGGEQSWLYTGRAFSVNSAPISAGWMALEREDIGGLTYWRVFIRARFQDGSQGRPLTQRPWDINARYRGQPSSYEQGGAYSPIPSGYWIDFTELASRYGWERLPAQINWRTYYPAAQFSIFVMRDGLDWRSAMAQLYPVEALTTPTPIYTATPTITFTPSPWYNWMITPSITPTVTFTATRRPTFTPNP